MKPYFPKKKTDFVMRYTGVKMENTKKHFKFTIIVCKNIKNSIFSKRGPPQNIDPSEISGRNFFQDHEIF